MHKYRIKNIFNQCFLFIILLAFSACKSDEVETIENPNFPDVVDLSISKPGDNSELHFEVNSTWNLSTSKVWCKFISGEDTLSSLNGLAGEHTVKIALNDDAWSFEDAKAEIIIGMQKETKVIANLTRLGKSYIMQAYGDSVKMIYDSENPITFLWNSFGTVITRSNINIIANFNWKLVSYPEWVIFTNQDALTGLSGELVSNSCRYSPIAPIRSEVLGELIFADKNGEQKIKLPIKYEGIRADVIQFKMPGRSQYNYIFDFEGKNYWEQTTDGTAPIKVTSPLRFSIMANEKQNLNFGYFKESSKGLILLGNDERWYSTTYPKEENNWEVEISVQPNNTNEERKGRIVVMPDTVFNNNIIKSDFQNILDNSSGKWGIKNEFSKYIAIAFAQEYEEKLGFKLTDAYGNVYPAPIFNDASEAVFGTKNVFMCQINSASMPEQLTIEALGYGAGIPNVDPIFNGTNSIWAGLSASFNSSNQLVLKKVASSATSSPMVFTYYKDGQIYAVIVIMRT